MQYGDGGSVLGGGPAQQDGEAGAGSAIKAGSHAFKPLKRQNSSSVPIVIVDVTANQVVNTKLDPANTGGLSHMLATNGSGSRLSSPSKTAESGKKTAAKHDKSNHNNNDILRGSPDAIHEAPTPGASNAHKSSSHFDMAEIRPNGYPRNLLLAQMALL